MAVRLTIRPGSLGALALWQQSRSLSVGLQVGDDTKFYPVYVHHLSKVALEHFQNNHSEWIVDKSLDTGLKLNADGTFVLHFPGPTGNNRIWTSYDGGRKQHWLSVYKDGALERFLIKDVLAPVRLSEATVNSVVRTSVDKLISKVDAWEQAKG